MQVRGRQGIAWQGQVILIVILIERFTVINWYWVILFTKCVQVTDGRSTALHNMVVVESQWSNQSPNVCRWQAERKRHYITEWWWSVSEVTSNWMCARDRWAGKGVTWQLTWWWGVSEVTSHWMCAGDRWVGQGITWQGGVEVSVK